MEYKDVFKIKDYRPYIRNKCKMCGCRMTNTLAKYIKRGNYCAECENKCELMSRKSAAVRRNYIWMKTILSQPSRT